MEDMPCEVEAVPWCVGLRRSESLPDEASLMYCQYLREKHEGMLCAMIHFPLEAAVLIAPPRTCNTGYRAVIPGGTG